MGPCQFVFVFSLKAAGRPCCFEKKAGGLPVDGGFVPARCLRCLAETLKLHSQFFTASLGLGLISSPSLSNLSLITNSRSLFDEVGH